jgi:outer membrane protease
MTGAFGKTRLFLVAYLFSAAIVMFGQARAAEESSEKSTADPPQAFPVSEVNSDGPTVVPAGMSEAVPDDAVEMNVVPSEVLTDTPKPNRVWTIDYRIKSFCNSNTANEIGTSPNDTLSKRAPLSRLRFPINSAWTGVQVGVEKPNTAVHFEWLTPLGRTVNGNFADFDWADPSDPSKLTDLGFAYERWNEGQSINLDMEFKLTDRFFGRSIELWPMGGFRWQRFNLTGYDATQVMSNGQPDGGHYSGDIITYNQQFYQAYFGGQLKRTLDFANQKQIRLTFQGDWGPAWGYNIDHHLITQPSFYARERTQGDSWHVGLTAEVPLSQQFSLGVQGDYMKIFTTGRTWDTRTTDSWTNGVNATSEQTSITAFGRFSF